MPSVYIPSLRYRSARKLAANLLRGRYYSFQRALALIWRYGSLRSKKDNCVGENGVDDFQGSSCCRDGWAQPVHVCTAASTSVAFRRRAAAVCFTSAASDTSCLCMRLQLVVLMKQRVVRCCSGRGSSAHVNLSVKHISVGRTGTPAHRGGGGGGFTASV